MKIHIGGDHAGYALKEVVKLHLQKMSQECVDHGTYSLESTDYPDYAHQTAAAVAAEGSKGILICGSANGVCMTANKHRGIRAALCWNEEVAMLARQHNNANILCIPARFVSEEVARAMVTLFMETPFEGGRHEKRVNKIDLNT